ncbi:phosphate acyltransferase [Ligilactobacillus salitolerans]|uniref:Phosphate acyltransferase n=1 Tax=Ligilactobacillus salitolerans TaxID=1808352 RepID=A0A401IRH0_9LACO|nr:phosphate acyltransferase PlsX [Ligilactobacillus salitolerans]GBG94132.1 phosphate acyltransferase [Ligilactobacillus salitolerans]
MKIAVDAMGGDNAPEAIVAGVERARDEFLDTEFILYGDRSQIDPLLHKTERITLVQADEVIDMNDEPVRAIRRKKNSSMVLAATAVKKGEADALFSCGNTGALLAAGLLLVGRIKGIARPGLVSTLPVVSGDGSFNLLDSGANADGKPEQLYQYALLGKYYATSVRGIENPRIGLLNNGTEPHKGSKLTLEAHQLIAADDSINFVGNVESRDLLDGVCDVVVADGFTGNAVLKAIEGTASSVMHLLKDSIMNAGIGGKVGALLLKSSLNQIKAKMDQSQYGGAVLLGAQAPVVKAHGASDSETVYYTVKQIKSMIDGQMLPKFTEYFSAQQAAAAKKDDQPEG